MAYGLDQRLAFPHPSLADEDGLLAVGGDLTTKRLLLAYQHGIFPWYSDDSPILWYAPPKRFVLDPLEIKISKSTLQFIRNSTLTTSHNTAFREVILNCARTDRKDQDGTWITSEMQEAYIELHEQGYAHSFETYNEEGNLVGGLYGIQVGKVFCGESMFTKESNASKLALIYLCKNFNFDLIDCQIHSDHLTSLGAHDIDGSEYYDLLKQQNFKPHDLKRIF